MTAGDREAIEALRRRIDHVAAIADTVANANAQTRLGFAIGGMGEMLTEAAQRLDSILNRGEAR